MQIAKNLVSGQLKQNSSQVKQVIPTVVSSAKNSNRLETKGVMTDYGKWMLPVRQYSTTYTVFKKEEIKPKMTPFIDPREMDQVVDKIGEIISDRDDKTFRIFIQNRHEYVEMVHDSIQKLRQAVDEKYPGANVELVGVACERTNKKGEIILKDEDAIHRHFLDRCVIIQDYNSVEEFKATILNENKANKAIDMVLFGWGFMSENPEAIKFCEESGVIAVAPHSESIKLLGDKHEGMEIARKEGVKMVPKSGSLRVDGHIDVDRFVKEDLSVVWKDIQKTCEETGIEASLILKPTAGGGGRGMLVIEKKYIDYLKQELQRTEIDIEKIVRESLDFFGGKSIISENVLKEHIQNKGDIDQFVLKQATSYATKESEGLFGDGNLLGMQYIKNAKHYEVQVMDGDVLGLRDCTVQKNRQKFIEETLSVDSIFHLFQKQGESIEAAKKKAKTFLEKIGNDAKKLSKAVNYKNAGTDEFIAWGTKEGLDYAYIERNTRLQVENLVTAYSVGMDLFFQQIRSALWLTSIQKIDNPVEPKKHVIQLRVYAEDENFKPSLEFIQAVDCPQILPEGIRVYGLIDRLGNRPTFDPLLYKIEVQADTRVDALEKAIAFLETFKVYGPKTNIELIKTILKDEQFQKSNFYTTTVQDRKDLTKVTQKNSTQKDNIVGLAQFFADINTNEFSHNLLPIENKPLKEITLQVPDPLNQVVKNSIKEEFEEILHRLTKDVEGNVVVVPEAVDQLNAWLKARCDEGYDQMNTLFRDAHQSLYMTRMRTVDIAKLAVLYSQVVKDFTIFHQVWGGAVSQVESRFLFESATEKMSMLREKMPSAVFSMLLRGANLVGFAEYNQEIIDFFAKYCVQTLGIKHITNFHSLNNPDKLVGTYKAFLEAGGFPETTLSVEGNKQTRDKYSMDYYRLVLRDYQTLGLLDLKCLYIKSANGAMDAKLVQEIIELAVKEFGVQTMHIHTHDTGGFGGEMYKAAKEKAHELGAACIVDMTMGFSKLTSQPDSTEGNSSKLQSLENQEKIAFFKECLKPFAEHYHKCDVFANYTNAQIERIIGDLQYHGIAGGQFSNLFFQLTASESIDFSSPFDEWITEWENFRDNYYAKVNNEHLKTILVTPTAKLAGDVAFSIYTSGLTVDDYFARCNRLSSLVKELEAQDPLMKEVKETLQRDSVGLNRFARQHSESALAKHVGQLKDLLDKTDSLSSQKTLSEIRGTVLKIEAEYLKITQQAEREGKQLQLIIFPTLLKLILFFKEKENEINEANTLQFQPTFLDYLRGAMGKDFDVDEKKFKEVREVLPYGKAILTFTNTPVFEPKPMNIRDVEQKLAQLLGRTPTEDELAVYLLDPVGCLDREKYLTKYSEWIVNLPTHQFFYGIQEDDVVTVMDQGESIDLTLEAHVKEGDKTRMSFRTSNGDLIVKVFENIKVETCQDEHDVGATTKGLVMKLPDKFGHISESGALEQPIEVSKGEVVCIVINPGKVSMPILAEKDGILTHFYKVEADKVGRFQRLFRIETAPEKPVILKEEEEYLD